MLYTQKEVEHEGVSMGYSYHTWKPPIRWNIKIIITKEQNSTHHWVLWREVVNEI
jgi:hypothetical protein